jgi:SOS-response transcriptional repressor LexA
MDLSFTLRPCHADRHLPLPKRSHPTWNPALEPLDLAVDIGVELPLLGYVTAGQPIETPEDRETVRCHGTCCTDG